MPTTLPARRHETIYFTRSGSGSSGWTRSISADKGSPENHSHRMVTKHLPIAVYQPCKGRHFFHEVSWQRWHAGTQHRENALDGQHRAFAGLCAASAERASPTAAA